MEEAPKPASRGVPRTLALELARVTERAAIAAARLRGQGDEKAADQAAVDAMRDELNGCIGCASEMTMARLAIFLARSPVRSSAVASFMAATVLRRSSAIGWRRAIRRMHLRSTSFSSSSSL